MTKLEQDGDIKIIADTRTLRGTEQVLGGPMPAGCLYAPVDFIRKNPNTVQALTNAIVRADKWIQAASPQDVLRTVPESYLLSDKALYLFSFNKVKEAISPDGVISDAGAKTALKVIPTFNPEVKAKEIKLELTYTNEFVKGRTRNTAKAGFSWVCGAGSTPRDQADIPAAHLAVDFSHHASRPRARAHRMHVQLARRFV